jgi:hypothetical protein
VNAGTEEENRGIVASNGNGLEIRSRKYHRGKEGTRKKIRGNKIATAVPKGMHSRWRPIKPEIEGKYPGRNRKQPALK